MSGSKLLHNHESLGVTGRLISAFVLTFAFLCAFFLVSGQIASAQNFDDKNKSDMPVWENSALPALSTSSSRPLETQGQEKSDDFSELRLIGIDKTSRLEKFYSRRAGEHLRQFGYRTLGGVSGTSVAQARPFDRDDSTVPRGSVQDDFVVGIGDRLRIVVTGQQNRRKIYNVDSSGRIVIDGLGPVSVAGRKISEISAEISALAAARHNVNVFVSIDSVKQIQVLVLGHVASPGRQRVSAFDTVLDAVLEAGGIEKTGSLRRIKVIHRGESRVIDLYKLLMEDGANPDLGLKDGDRIIIPPIGPTMAVAGAVKRPGIYEIVPDLDTKNTYVTAEQALKLAGNILARGKNRLLHFDIRNNGSERTREIVTTQLAREKLSDASLLLVKRQEDNRVGQITLTGHTTAPGSYDLAATPTLGKLINSPAIFGPDIYPLIGIIKRRNPNNLGEDWMTFAPYLVTKGEFDRRLADKDEIVLFSAQDIRTGLSETKPAGSPERDAIFRGQEDPNNQKRQGISQVSYVFDSKPENRLAKSNPELFRFLKDYALSLRGAVRHPGQYPVAEGISLKALISAAGGLLVQANREHIEVTSQLTRHLRTRAGKQDVSGRISVNLTDPGRRTVLLGPGDRVRVKDTKSDVVDRVVQIKGEIRYPGKYDLAPGDTILDLIRRAGGLTDQAYPAGAIFSRAAERRQEERTFRAQAQELELSLARQLEKENDKPGIDDIRSVQKLISRLKNADALGRITVEADPSVLKTRPELDILLESGDKLYVPKRPLHVRVRGEVLSPSTLQFRKNKDAQDYISQAGGFTERADKNRSFVVFPDGSARPLEIGPWAHNDVLIPPGSTIVVPLDADQFSFIERVRDISEILSNLTISAVFLDNIND